MEETNNIGSYNIQQEQEEKSSFDFKTLYTTFLLNWKWFVLSLIICVAAAAIYLRYTTPKYQAYAKFLIMDNDNNGRSGRNSIMSAQNLGTLTNTMGIDNEIEILKSRSIAQQVVRELKLYVSYKKEGKVKDSPMYKTQPINVDIDPGSLERLNAPISLEIRRNGNQYNVTGSYFYISQTDPSKNKQYEINKSFSQLPVSINTRSGIITLTSNSMTPMADGTALKVQIMSPEAAANKYIGSLSVSQISKTTTITQLSLNDELPLRAIDYLKQLAICYNRQSNEDKNEIAIRTEEFINGRLEKINAELGDTEGSLEAYKKRNNMVELSINAQQAVQNQDAYSQRLAEANTQVALLQSISEYMNEPENKYQTLPSNVGLTDQSATDLINKYNEIVLQRNNLLRSASENSPIVTPLTAQLDDLSNSIRRAMNQARRNMEIQRNSVAQQYGKYSGQISSTPEQERILTQIGRQQNVKSGLYLTLLQKREENSISLAATADKGKLIDEPIILGKISPKASQIMLSAIVLALAIPALIIFLIRLFRYKIEGHDDVENLTSLPIIADVAIASESTKTKEGIVVHENQNSQMVEIFRSMRTNLQFMLGEGKKTIMFTSCNSGEGKTFNAANLAMSFALLDKKVIFVGLDIRKPRLADLFNINDHHHGITQLLIKNNPTEEEVKSQIVSSGINNKLDLLMAGPIPPNPTELVSRDSLNKIFEILKKNYDYIIIDTAPVGLVTDTLHIGRVADITVYVCRADFTPKSDFKTINDLNNEHKLPKMCIVINGIDMSKKKYGYYYGYHKYGYYGNYNSQYGDKNDTSVKL